LETWTTIERFEWVMALMGSSVCFLKKIFLN
jgi:hypothetical protein